MSYSNKITNLPQGTFNGFTNLKNLTLHRNMLTNLTNGTFKGMNNLEVLDLSHNEIINLPNGTFNGLSNLTNLNLRDNQITNLTDGTFDGLSYLKKLTYYTAKFDRVSNLTYIIYPLICTCSSHYTLRKLKALTKLNQKSLKLFGSCKSTNTSDVTVYDLNNIKSRMLFIITIMLLLSRS